MLLTRDCDDAFPGADTAIKQPTEPVVRPIFLLRLEVYVAEGYSGPTRPLYEVNNSMQKERARVLREIMELDTWRCTRPASSPALSSTLLPKGIYPCLGLATACWTRAYPPGTVPYLALTDCTGLSMDEAFLLFAIRYLERPARAGF